MKAVHSALGLAIGYGQNRSPTGSPTPPNAKLSGTEAAEWGVVFRAVPVDELEHDIETITERLASSPTVALGFTKWLLAAGHTETLSEQLHNEALALELSSRSEDFREGIAALREKRPPRFEGR